MRFTNEKEVKAWLNKIALTKRELTLKIDFFNELISDFDRLDNNINLYKSEINSLKQKMNILLSDVDRLFSLLDETERLVMTARYLNSVRWDFIEYHVFYSRRQSIRIHNEAIKKLIGQEVAA